MLESEDQRVVAIFTDGLSIFFTGQHTDGGFSWCTRAASAVTSSPRLVDAIDALRLVPVSKRVLFVSIVAWVFFNSISVGVELVGIVISLLLRVWVPMIVIESEPVTPSAVIIAGAVILILIG